jgi:hypothetical protein
MGRPLIVYLLIVTVGSFAFIPMNGPGRDLLSFVVLVGLAFVPALVVNAELVRRFATTSWPRRAIVGAAAWAGWCLFVALDLILTSRVYPVPSALLGPLAIFAGVGAGFSVLAFGGRRARPGIALAVLALAMTTLVVVFGFWMAGRWGSPA